VVYAEVGDRNAASSKCRNRGGYLAGVASMEHELMLLELAQDKACRSKEMWISLNDEEREGWWEWGDRDMTDTDYVNWQVKPSSSASAASSSSSSAASAASASPSLLLLWMLLAVR
jgi:hypothetical protein